MKPSPTSGPRNDPPRFGQEKIHKETSKVSKAILELGMLFQGE